MSSPSGVACPQVTFYDIILGFLSQLIPIQSHLAHLLIYLCIGPHQNVSSLEAWIFVFLLIYRPCLVSLPGPDKW